MMLTTSAIGAKRRIGRSYLSPLSKAERVTVRPPFKPCVRISRTRLTRWTSGRGMRHLRILSRAAQTTESQGLEERTAPDVGPADAEPRAGPLQQQAAQALLDVRIDLDEFHRRVARAKV